MSETATSSFKLLEDIQFWKRLLPNFSITDNVFQNQEENFECDASIKKDAKENLGVEGYYHLSSMLPSDLAQLLKQGVERLSEHGVMPVFAMMYDEYWLAIKRLQGLMTATLGDNWHLLPDLWVWNVGTNVNNTGWTPHRDLNELCLDENGETAILTVWVALSEASPLNSCIYVLPRDLDPYYPDRMPEFPNTRQGTTWSSYENFRALPAAPGDVLCWDTNLVHWGSRSSKHAKQPRISMAFYVQRGNGDPIYAPYLSLEKPFPFEMRLKLIAENLIRYEDRNKIIPDLAKWAAGLNSI